MASQQPIFRTIEVGVDQHIELGAPLTPDVRALMDPAPPGARQLRMRIGTFGNAASITVYLADDERVQHIAFTYDPGTDYAALAAIYTEELGPPHGTLPGTDQSSVWEDSQTRFELFARGDTVSSLLQDLTQAAG
jgi:hypothetical protein